MQKLRIRKAMTNKQFIAQDNYARCDVFLSENMPEHTRSAIKKLIDNGNVTINVKLARSSQKVCVGDCVEVCLPAPVECAVKPENIPLEIVYQDGDLAVINKPQGMTVHMGNGNTEGTLVNALLYNLDSLSGINGVIRPGIVHRIDKNTSGLLVVAKNDKSHVALAKQIEEKTCKRTYLALLEGNLKADTGTVRTYIGRCPNDRIKMAVVSPDKGKIAITDYQVIQRYEGYTLCRFDLQTGRTHQIRVHAKHLGHPVVGDDVYGYKSNKFKLNGQLLHAYQLQFIHPTTNTQMDFKVDLPDYFQTIIKKLKKI